MGRRRQLLRAVLRAGSQPVTGASVVTAVAWLIVVASLVANLVGVTVIILLILFVLPLPDGVGVPELLRHNQAPLVVYVATTAVIGIATVARRSSRALRWLREKRAPRSEERATTLALPRRVTAVSVPLWLIGAVIFTVHNSRLALQLGSLVATTVLVGGVVTVAVTYLLTGRVVRPATTRALIADPPTRVRRPGVALRTMLVWGLGTGLPLAGIASLGVRAWWSEPDPQALALAIVVLSLLALATGLLTMTLHARSLADPLRELRNALTRVGQGNFAVEVPIYDASELGVVQAGFNQMVAGLRERDHLRDLFGRHVGEDVARRALASDVELGGEERFVAALFVDVVGSTAIAERHPPAAVVEELNRFFGVVVRTVDSHGGLVNKFAGDAALCVWGAPLPHPDPAAAALAAARELAASYRTGQGVFDVTVGVSAGTAVAGNVGSEDRLEYTVVGDPVNEASRLTELAKRYPQRTLASGTAIAAASNDEARRWQAAGEETLRGRTAPTHLYQPVGG